ncbi:MAG: hypothetical protein O2992_14870 [Gemmatimonadetes bacterium]|nr:hypothetical protein [Gemmatimonadota bacterium]
MIRPRLAVWVAAVAVVGSLMSRPNAVQAQGRTHAVIVVGLGGTQEYRDRFHTQALALKAALTQRHGLASENVIYLGERPEDDPAQIDDKSTRANLLRVLGEVGLRSQPLDRLLVILIGHGTASRAEAQFNLSGPDLTPSDFQAGLIGFPTQTLALVHTGSASGGFVAPLSGPNRIIITATRTERERNATDFTQFFVEAMTSDGADLDKDERTSLLEAFLYARQETERYYEDENQLLTEHAMLDDNGDGEGISDAGLTGPDGPLAATFQLGGVSGTAGQTPDDPELARLYQERDEIQGRIDQLRAVREAMTEDAYLDAIEEMLVELALKSRDIRVKEGGGA